MLLILGGLAGIAAAVFGVAKVACGVRGRGTIPVTSWMTDLSEHLNFLQTSAKSSLFGLID